MDEYGYYCGIPIKMASYTQQKKCHKNILINWIFKKLYGYEEVSYLPDGTDIIFTNNTIYVRNLEALKLLEKAVKKKEKGE